jgi:hypothetical protein
MVKRAWNPEAELERRLDLVSRPENMGEDMNKADYLALFIVTLVIPILLMALLVVFG